MGKASELYFEAHITLGAAHHHSVDRFLLLHSTWHLSMIKGDEVLGPETRVYLTRRGSQYEELCFDMIDMCQLLEAIGVPWQRRKVEIAIFDERRA